MEKVIEKAREVLGQENFHFDKEKFVDILVQSLVLESNLIEGIERQALAYMRAQPQVATALLATVNKNVFEHLGNIKVENVDLGKSFVENFDGIFSFDTLLALLVEILTHGLDFDTLNALSYAYFDCVKTKLREALFSPHYKEILDDMNFIKKVYKEWLKEVTPTESGLELPPVEQLNPLV